MPPRAFVGVTPEATGTNVRLLPQIGVVAETSCRYLREIGFPEPVEAGLVVDKVGTSSIVYRIGLFQAVSDEAVRSLAGEAMEKAADAMPTLDAEEQRDWSLRR